MRVSLGDVLRLEGKTLHGKNRVREQGALWKVLRQDKMGKFSVFPEGTDSIWLESTKTKAWRIIKEKSDENFNVVEVICNE